MGITGVGFSQTYYYNNSTGKLALPGGGSNEFTDYFNGEVAAKDTKALNGYDEEQKNAINKFFEMMSWDWPNKVKDAVKPVEGQEDVYEITYTKDRELSYNIDVDGKTVFGRMPSFALNKELLHTYGLHNWGEDFLYTEHKPYDPETNSATITEGDIFDIGNGYQLEVTANGVNVIGYGKSPELDSKASGLANQLEAFVRFSSQEWFRGMVDLGGETGLDGIIGILGQTGVDVSKEFTINATRCKIENGVLYDVSNEYGYSNRIVDAEIARSRALREKLLSDTAVENDAPNKGEDNLPPDTVAGSRPNGSGMETLYPKAPVAEEVELVRGSSMAGMTGKQPAPYYYLADSNGKIHYNGVTFSCDTLHNVLSLGDISDSGNVLTIPLSNGGTLKVNRDNLGDLANAIGMFSPEDVERIMRAIAQDVKAEQMKLKIEEEQSSVGDSVDSAQSGTEETRLNGQSDVELANSPEMTARNADNYAYNRQEEQLFDSLPASVWEAWQKAGQETGVNGYGMSPDGKLTHISQVQLQLLMGQLSGDKADVFGTSVESALEFAEEALYRLQNPLGQPFSPEVQQLEQKEILFYKKFIENLKKVA